MPAGRVRKPTIAFALFGSIPQGGILRNMTDTKTPGYEAYKEQLLNRLARVEGQVGGDERTVEEDRHCIDVLGQIEAAQAALNKIAVGAVDDQVRDCMRSGDGACEAQVQELMGPVSQLVSS
jgi:DNA-binding FrmR family transcriptional regulator